MSAIGTQNHPFGPRIGFQPKYGRRPSGAISVRQRIETPISKGPWVRHHFTSVRVAISFICGERSEVCIVNHAQVAVPMRGENPRRGVSELWIDGSQVTGNTLRQLVDVGLQRGARKRDQNRRTIEKLDRDIAAIEAEAPP